MFTFKMKLWKWIAIIFVIYATLFFTAYSYAQNNQGKENKLVKSEFKYKLILKVDLKKREKILKENGETPTIYDKALSLINGDIYAADVVDFVENSSTTLKISSVMTPTTVLSYALGDKTFRRDSLSTQTKSGFISTSYAEKRGDSPRTTARVDYKSSKVSFYEGAKLGKSESIKTDSFDMLSIIYQGVGLSAKGKTYLVNNSKSIKPMSFEVGELWDISINGKKYKAKRYYKKTTKTDSATFEIWIDEETKIPLRYQIGLSDSYGVTMLFELNNHKVYN
jgi:hypothetical protein